jgi:hypothetical protein
MTRPGWHIYCPDCRACVFLARWKWLARFKLRYMPDWRRPRGECRSEPRLIRKP